MPDPDVSISWQKYEKPGSPGTWVIKATVCNLRDKAVDVYVIDNPWKKDGTKASGVGGKYYPFDLDKEGKMIPGSATKKAKQHGKKVSLPKKGDATACQSVEFEYPWEPIAGYTDVYYYKADGVTPEDEPCEGGGGVHNFDADKVGYVHPSGPHPLLAVALPIPYPMSVETVCKQPIEVAITEINGLPDECELVATVPPMGIPLRLEPGDRASLATVAFRVRKALPPGVRHGVTVHQRILSPKRLRDWPERLVSFDLVGEAPPEREARSNVPKNPPAPRRKR